MLVSSIIEEKYYKKDQLSSVNLQKDSGGRKRDGLQKGILK